MLTTDCAISAWTAFKTPIPTAPLLQHSLRVFENTVLKKIFGPKRDEVILGWKNCIMWSFITCTVLQV
jgi:hypothetical protein